MRTTCRRGFVLYIVITVLLGLAILAFALNTFKTGAVTQLSRNVDQNRLALMAQSANSELIAMIKSRINLNPLDSQIASLSRFVFVGGQPPVLPLTIDLVTNFEPQETIKLAKVGYNLKIRSSAVLTVFRRSIYKSMSAYNGYIDVVSKAWREGVGEITMEAHERRDVRMIDLRHTLDKYALFVKNYCNDYNNTSRRLSVNGIYSAGSHDISRIYIGTDNYPACKDPRKDLWFDLFHGDPPGVLKNHTNPKWSDLFAGNPPGGFKGHKNLNVFSQIFGQTNLKAFTMAPEAPADHPKFTTLFYEGEKKFNTLSGVTKEMFVLNAQVVNEYERVVNLAADACMVQAGVATEPYRVSSALIQKSRNAMNKLNNENALAYRMCKDFADNAVGGNYSECNNFKLLLETCKQYWTYRWGYTDAASVWKVDTPGRAPEDVTLPDRFAGLAAIRMGSGNYGPYMAEYREQVDGKQYNPERSRVGRMQHLYGAENNIPVLVEGNAYLRFFKIAYLDEFTATVEFAVGPTPVHIRVITNKYLRKDKPDSFLTRQLGDQLAPGPYDDRFMKSRAIDELSVNTLWGDKIKYYDGDGNEQEYDPALSPTTTIPLPAQPTGSAVAATNFGRLVDFKLATWNYVSAEAFLAERAPGEGKLLYLDGFMYIAAGDLDLSNVTHFQGKGLIYIGLGNCKLANLERIRSQPTNDSLRIYLRRGDFIINPAVDDILIEASLTAFYDPPGDPSPLRQGNIIMNDRSRITIYGNLLVDSLSLQASGNSGLAENGLLEVIHDPAIYNPGGRLEDYDYQLDPYNISVGPVKTSFSFRAGGSES